MSEDNDMGEEDGFTEEVGSGNKRKADGAMPPKPRKRYAKRAQVWQHFVEKVDDSRKSICKYCATELWCESKTIGTSPMIAHLGRCKDYKDFDQNEKQKILSSDSSGNMRVVKYDPQLFRKSVNEMVVVNELPLSFVESEGWKRLVFNLLPMYQTFSRRTCGRDIVSIYEREKAALLNLFRIEKQRVSLTTDIWEAPSTSCNYMAVTAYWINKNRVMHKRIISFKVITDHKGKTISGQLMDCLEEWGIEKVFTVTVDNAKGNDKALTYFKDAMRLRWVESLVLDGDILHIRCCARILNLIVRDGLKKVKPSILAIRNAVKYVRSSFTRLKSFVMRCETGKVSRGNLPLDVKTRWNSTYLMLTSAIKLRVAFEKMLSEDKLYCDYFLEDDEKTKKKRVAPPPCDVNWDEVCRLVNFLKIIYKCTLIFSASKTVASTLCYNEIVNIERNLITKCGNPDDEIKKQAHLKRDKFDKYWDGLSNMNPLVIVASVFDPRNKMKFATLCFDQLYGKDTIVSRKLNNSVSKALKDLYEEYSLRLLQPEQDEPPKDSQPSSTFELSNDDDDDCERMDSIYNKLLESRRSEVGSSELEIYLSEKTEIRVENNLGLPYDVLSWWKCNSSKFPVLSEVARDVLAVQMSSVASESVFSTSGRVLDPYRSSLTPYMVEVLICGHQNQKLQM